VAGCFECGDEPSGSCATELVNELPHLQRSCSLSLCNAVVLLLVRWP
jgi:hypothetical protein